MSRIFSSAEPDPQLTWTAMNIHITSSSLIARNQIAKGIDLFLRSGVPLHILAIQ